MKKLWFVGEQGLLIVGISIFVSFVDLAKTIFYLGAKRGVQAKA